MPAKTIDPGARPRTEHGLWPLPATELLLRAALLDGAAARSAFADWLAGRVDIEPARLDSPDRRLLPLVAANLESLDVRHPFLAACRALRAGTEERNRRLLRAAADAVAVLAHAGVGTLALKGVPLLLEYYDDPALRPMSDVDLIIRARDLPRALAALRGAGWRERPTPLRLRPYLCAVELDRETDGVQLDLHQYLIEFGSSPELEDGLWRRAHALDVLGARSLSPSPADLLLHVCLSGLKAGGRHRNSRWIPDAMRIVGHSEKPVDWDVLVAEAERRGSVLPIRECLQYLVELAQAPVPAVALAELWNRRERWWERFRYRILARHEVEGGRDRDLLRRSPLRLLARYWGLYWFGARARGVRAGPAGFVRFVQLTAEHRLRLLRPWVLPGASSSLRRLADEVLEHDAVLETLGQLQRLKDRLDPERYPRWYASDNQFGSRLRMERAHRAIVELALATLSDRGGPVLDLGCGNGALLRTIHQAHPTLVPFGIERARERVEHARVLLPRFADNFVEGDLLDDDRPWSGGRRYALILLAPSRLVEAGPERSAKLRARLREHCDRLLVYAYGRGRPHHVGLAALAERAGLRLLGSGPNLQASLAALE